MMRLLWVIGALFTASSCFADVVVPVRTIRPKELLQPADFTVKSLHQPGAITSLQDVVGNEARVALYPGRPVRQADIGPPAVIDRNQVITLVFTQGSLHIATDGRALGRGAIGDTIKVMNLASRNTLTGRITGPGTVSAGR